jgi:hypothetical protein
VSSPRFAAISNDPVAEQATGECLLGGSSALAAVLAGFFASAGANAGVLLGPLSILVAGVGAGVRAFDGRLRQPGLGTKRPRGFREEDPVPDAAYIAVPNAVAAVAVAQAYDEERSLGPIVKYGIHRALRAGAQARAELLQVVRGMGAAAFSDPAFVRPLLHVAGASEGGLLTPTDFAAVPMDIDLPATAHPACEGWFETPWAHDGEPADGSMHGRQSGGQMVVVAFDSRGVAAAISYQRTKDGIGIDAMELEAPRAAVPVLRGVTRVAPGERIPCPACMAIYFEAGRPVQVVASPNVLRLGPAHMKQPQLSIRRDPTTRNVSVTRR